jgi:2-keto-4-pentenoate hydratase/2-oxohepta-3-ene-1,7-dioic acid hydratase in catechol pathway
MRLVTYRGRTGKDRIGAVVRERVVDLSRVLQAVEERSAASGRDNDEYGGGMLRFLAAGAPAMDAASTHLSEVEHPWRPDDHAALADVTLAAPIPRPGKIVAIGRNYADHTAESGIKPFEKPRIIAKLSSAVTGPGAVVVRPAGIVKLDYEVEMAVVIGKRTKLVAREHALDAVAGYTALNDISAREFQFDVSPAQTTFAKSMDGFCPLGPWIVTHDEIPDPQNIALKLWVNGELLQDGNTHDMIFGVARLIEYISAYMTLEPGDLIATGTPAGVGAFRTPPRWLQPGDRLRLELSQIGRLEHSIG